MNQTTEIVKEQKEKVLLGAIGAFLFALAGGVMWYLLYKAGFLVGISGAVAVIAAMRGYTYFAKVRSIKGLVISVVMAVIVLVLAWYMCLATDVYEAFQDGYESGDLDHKIPFLTAFLSASGFLQDKDIAFVYFKDLAIGLLLCIGASLFSIKAMLNEIKRENLQAVSDEEETEDEEAEEEVSEDEVSEEEEAAQETPAEEN